MDAARTQRTRMNDIFHLLNALRSRKHLRGSPFASPKDTANWLKTLPAGDSDYDLHHALVEGLERFNAEHAPATLGRMASLLKLEEAGAPLQARVVEQYLHDQPVSGFARRTLWRESWAYWSLLADAWFALLKNAWRTPASAELKPHTAEMGVRALRYMGLARRWEAHRGQAPAETAWRRLHKIYRLIEREGYLHKAVTLDGERTHCAREYTRVVLMALIRPEGCSARDIEAMADLLALHAPLPLPARALQRGVHSHVIDLSLNAGARLLDHRVVEGRRLRYLALGDLVLHLRTQADAYAHNRLVRQAASLIMRGGVGRNNARTQRFGRVWAAVGQHAVLDALERVQAGGGAEPWILRDESGIGMGFASAEPVAYVPGQPIAVSWEPANGGWQLLVMRWKREEDGQHLVGAQLLSRHPKRVDLGFDDASSAAAILLPMADPDAGGSQLLLPVERYREGEIVALRDGDAVYRIRLDEALERHEDWVRVRLDVLARETPGAD